MSNLFETGSETVNRMCRLQFTGNVIPSTWYHTIKKETGKPNLNAIIILADIVYWYRPMEIRDEATGQLCGFKKKFQADILQRNYQQLADQFGITAGIVRISAFSSGTASVRSAPNSLLFSP